MTGSDALAGLSQTFSVLGAALMALPLARLTAAGGRRRALISGWTTSAIGMLIAVLGGSLNIVPVMLLGSMVAGTGAASAYQARFAAVDLALPAHRARDLSLVVWASTVGSVAGPNLLPVTTDWAARLGLRPMVGPYLFASITLLLAALVAFIWLRPDPYLLSRNEAATAAHSIRASLALLRRNAAARQAVTGIVIGHIAMVSVMVMTPVHMGAHDTSLRIIGLVISVHVLGMYAFSPVMGALADRFGRPAVIRLGSLILLASLAVSGLAAPTDNQMLALGLFLLGLGWSATLVGGSALLSESVPVADRPTAQGASDLLMNSGAALGGAAAGVVISVTSYSMLCAITAVPVVYLGWKMRTRHSA